MTIRDLNTFWYFRSIERFTVTVVPYLLFISFEDIFEPRISTFVVFCLDLESLNDFPSMFSTLFLVLVPVIGIEPIVVGRIP